MSHPESLFEPKLPLSANQAILSGLLGDMVGRMYRYSFQEFEHRLKQAFQTSHDIQTALEESENNASAVPLSQR